MRNTQAHRNTDNTQKHVNIYVYTLRSTAVTIIDFACKSTINTTVNTNKVK